MEGETTFAIGIDWGGTNLRAGLVEISKNSARVIAFKRVPWSSASCLEESVDKVTRLVAELGSSAGQHPVAGLGLGLAAMLDPRQGLIFKTPNMCWDASEDSPIPLARMLKKSTGLEVTLANDLSAIAWGERCFGAGEMAREMLCVFLGTGVGAAHISSGRLVEGAFGVATELGHLRIEPGGRPCGCGQRGCVEAYLGGRNLGLRLAAELGPEGPGKESSLLGSDHGESGSIHPGHVDQAATDGDQYASDLWDELSEILARALAYAVTLLDPGVMVMGGQVWEGCPELRRRTLVRMKILANPPAVSRLRVVDARLEDRAGVLGAAALSVCR